MAGGCVAPPARATPQADRCRRSPNPSPLGIDLFLVSPNAKHLHRLTHQPHLINDSPTWSADGKRIAFFFGRLSGGGPEGILGLAVIDRDGSHRHTILRIRGHMYGRSPDWQRR